MKINLKIIISFLIVMALFIGVLGVFYNNNIKAFTESQLSLEKKQLLDQEQKKIAENEKKTFVRPKPDYSLLNDKSPVWTKTGVFNLEEGFQFPFSSAIQSQFKFTNIAYTPFDLLIAGSLDSDPSKGVIIDCKIDPNTRQDSIINYYFPGKGTITLTQVNGNTVLFKTSNGESGQIDVMTGKSNLEYTLK